MCSYAHQAIGGNADRLLLFSLPLETFTVVHNSQLQEHTSLYINTRQGHEALVNSTAGRATPFQKDFFTYIWQGFENIAGHTLSLGRTANAEHT